MDLPFIKGPSGEIGYCWFKTQRAESMEWRFLVLYLVRMEAAGYLPW
jgi:hypothetical protein